MKKICIIPARMAASRFPGKPLKLLLGIPLIQHVYFRCRLYSSFDRIAVATCDPIIAESIRSIGGEVVMTAETHERATDRVEEAIARMQLELLEDDLVLMVQGDEVLVSPDMISSIVQKFRESRPAVVNLVTRLYNNADHQDPNCMKAVMAPDGRILYFSRAPIPSRSREPEASIFQQTGVIAFRADFIPKFSRLSQTPLEKIESCDMLRVLENGIPILAACSDLETIGVDTEVDRARAENKLCSDPLTKLYLGISF